nr:exosome complex exonuclease RRP46 homolog [Ipomoea trifida]GMD44229.1 exosome complex exonuclease RRP46 homolog [Ipomoea batatas]
MEIDRADGRTANQLRPLACSRGVLNRAHGSASWSQGDTKVLAAVYGPKAGTKKNENPEKACIEVIWKPKTGQIGKHEKECEMIVKRTLQSICLLTVHPNTTTSVIIQVVNDDGAKMKAFVYLVFPNSPHLALPKESLQAGGEPMECGIITSVTHGKLEVDDYLLCLNRGRAASAKLSEYLRRSLQSQLTTEPSNF